MFALIYCFAKSTPYFYYSKFGEKESKYLLLMHFKDLKEWKIIDVQFQQSVQAFAEYIGEEYKSGENLFWHLDEHILEHVLPNAAKHTEALTIMSIQDVGMSYFTHKLIGLTANSWYS